MNEKNSDLKSFVLYPNYPNPFNPITTIKYIIPVQSQVKVIIYNSIGEKVGEVFNGQLEEGYHEVKFNASTLPSGVYFYKMETKKYNQIKKMILLR